MNQSNQRVLIYLAHPAHVHFFRHIIESLEKKQTEVFLMARDKDITLELIEDFGLLDKVEATITQRRGMKGIFFELLWTIAVMMKIMLFKKIDYTMAIGGESVAIASKLLFKKSYTFTDTEKATWTNKLALAFGTANYVPSCYEGLTNQNTKKYPSYHELAYLHPSRFVPKKEVLASLGMKDGEPFFLLRFVSWKAIHDRGEKGLTEEGKKLFVKRLEQKGKVFISAEGDLPKDLKSYELNIPKKDIHHVLYYATLYVGEGATMASECALLGTPSIYVSTIEAGTIKEQKNLGILHWCKTEGQGYSRALEIANIPYIKKSWRERTKEVLTKKEDLTKWIMEELDSKKEDSK